jgi:DNA polymerase III epsilon subunit-like protein
LLDTSVSDDDGVEVDSRCDEPNSSPTMLLSMSCDYSPMIFQNDCSPLTSRNMLLSMACNSSPITSQFDSSPQTSRNMLLSMACNSSPITSRIDAPPVTCVLLSMGCDSSPVTSETSVSVINNCDPPYIASHLCHSIPVSSPHNSPSVIPLTLKYDMGWQKRSSGRAYNSLSGIGSMIGHNTGKIVGYGLRCKTCRVCAYWKAKNIVAPAHKCVINFTGSSKAMEPDVACEIVRKLEDRNDVIVNTLVMDEDCTTIARVRNELAHEVEKWSDIMHIKKHLMGNLYKLHKSYRVLSADVIKYIMRCFSYALNQNKGNVDGVKLAILNVVPHIFGDHVNCGDWCRHRQSNSNNRPGILPNGISLSGELRTALEPLFNELAHNASKIAPCATTRENESFNNMVASEAPKARHYSSSFSLEARLECAVAQKNRGHMYLNDVFKGLSLSPGVVYGRYAATVDRKRKLVARYKSNIAYKRRRLNCHKTRSMSQVTNELREGVTYGTGVDLNEVSNADIETIPQSVDMPLYQPLHEPDMKMVFFDLETTSLNKQCDLIQVSAYSEDDIFNQYVFPKQAIGNKVTELTGLAVRGNSMYHNGAVVEAVDIVTCLKSFIQWLKKFKPALLIAHNCKRFDSYRLVYQLMNINDSENMNMFVDAVYGFADTLPMFRDLYKGELVNYKLSTVAAHVLDSDFVYDAHNAKEDVLALQRIVSRCGQQANILQYSFSVSAIIQEIERDKHLHLNFDSLQPLVERKVCGLAMLRKMAASGLSLNHLKLAYTRNGDSGLQSIFGEQDSNKKVRVTKSKKIAHVIGLFLAEQ